MTAGSGIIHQEMPSADNTTLLLFGDGDMIRASAGEAGVRFLLISGKPLGEPVAWQGPIVMNTREELPLMLDKKHDKEGLTVGNIGNGNEKPGVPRI